LSGEIVSRQRWSGGLDLEVGWRRVKETASPLRPAGIVLHHTEESEAFNEVEHSLCIARLGWCDLSYHLLICPHGVVFEGRRGGVQEPVQGAHALKNNDRSIGIALMGNYDQQSPTSTAWDETKRIVAAVCSHLSIDATETMEWNRVDSRLETTPVQLSTIIGHRDLRATICPGDQLYRLLPQLRQ
jgi:hypothetical protein